MSPTGKNRVDPIPRRVKLSPYTLKSFLDFKIGFNLYIYIINKCFIKYNRKHNGLVVKDLNNYILAHEFIFYYGCFA